MDTSALLDFLTVSQASRELGITTQGVRDRIERGQMTAQQVSPKLWLIPRSEVERWKELGRQKTGPKLGSKRKRPEATATAPGQPKP